MENEDDLSQKKKKKKPGKYDIFLKCSEKMVFSKRIALGHHLSCTIWEGAIFFLKTRYFFTQTENERDDLSQEIHGNMIFSI